jgi:histidine triad (HIT) family protein
MDCIFCKIAQGELPANIIYQNDAIVAFDDIHPQAPHHIILVPRKHISTLNDLKNDDKLMMGELIDAAAQLAKKLDLAEDGYRVVLNCNKSGGQTVFHIHAHLLGGRSMTWPPG